MISTCCGLVQLWKSAALADGTEGTIYSDLAGKLPFRSFKGNQYIYIYIHMLCVWAKRHIGTPN